METVTFFSNQQSVNTDFCVLNVFPAVTRPKDTTYDDGQSGFIMGVWKVSDSDKQPVEKSQYGHFYSQESYIVLYKV